MMVMKSRKSRSKPRSKIDWDTVDKIRKEYEEGATYKVLSEKYKLNQSSIGRIIRKETWLPGDRK